jgi:hypothetical protein
MQSGQKLSGPPKAEYHFVNKKPKTEGELEQERKYSLDPLPYRNVLTQVIGTFTKQRLIEFRIFTGLI